MKRFLCLLLSVVFVIAPISSLASGADADLVFSYDKASKNLTLNGKMGEKEHIACMVYIYDASLSPDELSDENTPAFADIVITGADGLFNFERILSNDYESGKYIVMVSSSQASWSTEFMYANEGSVSSLLTVINAASSPAALENALTSNLTELGIDADSYLPVKNYVSAFLFATKPSGGYGDAFEFINALEQNTAAAYLKIGSDASEILQTNARTISIDFENDYNKFSSDVKTAIGTELKNADYTKGLLSLQYPELRTVAFMKAAPTWQALKNAFYGVDSEGNTIVSNYSAINPDTSVFNSLTNKDEVFALMFKRRAELTSVEAIRTVFKSCSEQAFKDEQNSNSGNSNNNHSSQGSSGSSQGSGPVSIQPGYTNQYTEPVKPALFYDTQTTDWYYPSVEKLAALSLINGYEDKSFKPDNPITRAEYTKLIVGLADYLSIHMDEVNSDVSFADVSSADWYADVVYKAAAGGIIMGSGDGFNPNDYITRQDAAVILYRLASKVKSIDGSKEFSDNNAIADYAKEAVSALAGASIISGMGDNSFAPTQNLTRAQAAKLLCGVLEFLS